MATITPWRCKPLMTGISADSPSTLGSLGVVRSTSLCTGKYLKSCPPRYILILMATPRPEPVRIQDHAIDNLRYIRQTIERAGSFTAVPGIGGMLMGSTALAAAWVADRQPGHLRWLLV